MIDETEQELRRRAEQLHARRSTSPMLEHESSLRLAHELEVHRIELELQNEQLRRSEQALVESRDRYRSLYDSAPVGYVTLTDSGRVLAANQRAADMLGASRADLEGAPLQRWLDVAAADGLHLHLQAIVAGGQRDTRDLEFIAADGRRVWLQLDSVRAEFPRGGQTCCQTALSDLSELRRLEARVGQRLATIGRMTASVAHEFNNLLMGMLGCVEELRAGARPEEQPALDGLDASIARGSAFTRRLLDLGRSDEVSHAIELDAVVRANENILRTTVGAQVELEFVLGAAGGRVGVAKGELEQILVNLVVNARDAVGGRGRIRVETAALDRDGGPHFELRVIDDGVGVGEDIQDQLFEPFFTTKREGCGLGLATVRSIVTRAGGQVSVDSTPGEGATVGVVLPGSSLPLAPAPASHSGSVAVAASGDVHVLLVEDEALVRLALRTTLERAGYRVFQASDGTEGLELLRSLPRLDLLVTDIVLPGVDGVALVNGARARDPRLPVLVMSAYDNDMLVSERGLPNGVPTLQKPFSGAELLTRVSELLDPAWTSEGRSATMSQSNGRDPQHP